MEEERSQPTDEHASEFWSLLAHELQSRDALSARPDGNTTLLTPEQEQLLWDFAEGRLDEAGEERCLDLVSSNSAAVRRLLEMQAALDAAESMPQSSAEAAWESAASRRLPTDSRILQHVRHLIIELAEAGLHLIYSAGRPAFAPALARSEDVAPPTSVAHEFLTSVGTIQLVVDQNSPTTCALTVVASRPLHPDRLDAVQLKLESVDRSETATATWQDQRARFEELGAGSFQLTLSESDRLLDQLSFELKLRPAEDAPN